MRTIMINRGLMQTRPAMGRFQVWALVAVGILFESCGGGAKTVRPDEMSAEKHRAEAQRENIAADNHAKAWTPSAAKPSPFRNPIDSSNDFLYPLPVYNPTDWHLAEVEKHRAHARQHETAAQSLEKFEGAECKDFPPATRAACPLLGPAQAMREIDGGVSIRMAPSVRVDAVVAHMMCHLAYARAHGYQEETNCPLYMPGLSVKRGSDPATIDITVADKWRVAELRRHAYEEVVVSTRLPH